MTRDEYKARVEAWTREALAIANEYAATGEYVASAKEAYMNLVVGLGCSLEFGPEEWEQAGMAGLLVRLEYLRCGSPNGRIDTLDGLTFDTVPK